MFTGIIESLGTVAKLEKRGSNVTFSIQSPISKELKEDQSISHNGVCLTVTKVSGDTHLVTAIEETLSKSSLGNLKEGDLVNLERCLLNNGRFDGHIVQGHVDTIATCISVDDRNGSWIYDFNHPIAKDFITVEKGSIAVNGVSLTCFDARADGFKVAIIPYTFEHTNFKQIKKGSIVNLEFDILGKYVRRLLTPVS
jgi:riboflavin synthase